MSKPLLTPAEQTHLDTGRNHQHFPDDFDRTPINWERLHALIPWMAFLFAVAVWAMFLLIPTAFGLHYAGMFPAANNWLYVLMGLTLCMACFVAAQVKHGARAILFAFAVLLLSYWF
ncbi:MAG: hypothetical protein L3K52_07965 [Candidatus Thiothrix sulfatifontis]|nr:MAG: hypothetical protein L3K52_07965 [Candidatus Thiothrix sulfatifontis]